MLILGDRARASVSSMQTSLEDPNRFPGPTPYPLSPALPLCLCPSVALLHSPLESRRVLAYDLHETQAWCVFFTYPVSRAGGVYVQAEIAYIFLFHIGGKKVKEVARKRSVGCESERKENFLQLILRRNILSCRYKNIMIFYNNI